MDLERKERKLRKILLPVFGIALLFMSPSFSTGQEEEMDPPPADRKDYQFKREPGQFKKDKLGFIDPSPDVVSLTALPKDDYGFVDWTKAINNGIISPKEAIPPAADPKPEGIESVGDVLIKSKLEFMPDVIFPHSAHTIWLKCSNCHDKIFQRKAGATPITMAGIWKGEYCGRCHDKVAFPTRNCFRCHSAPRK